MLCSFSRLLVLMGFWVGFDCPRMRTDWFWVVPHKIDGSLTRSLSRGRGLGFWMVGTKGFGVF
jgi:hypothetical protein